MDREPKGLSPEHSPQGAIATIRCDSCGRTVTKGVPITYREAGGQGGGITLDLTIQTLAELERNQSLIDHVTQNPDCKDTTFTAEGEVQGSHVTFNPHIHVDPRNLTFPLETNKPN